MKRFVDMIVRFKEDGQIIPLQINFTAIICVAFRVASV